MSVFWQKINTNINQKNIFALQFSARYLEVSGIMCDFLSALFHSSLFNAKGDLRRSLTFFLPLKLNEKGTGSV